MKDCDTTENAVAKSGQLLPPSPEQVGSVGIEATSSTPRTVSHQLSTNESVPQVVFANNRHIIPDNLFRSSPHTKTKLSPAILPKSQGLHPDSPRRSSSVHESDLHKLGGSPTRPILEKQHPSWGATTVNTKLKEQVLREVFGPPLIHHHHRHLRSHRALRSKDLRDLQLADEAGDCDQ